jgi:hypothetical protein
MSSSGQCPRTPAVGARWRAQTTGSAAGAPPRTPSPPSLSRSPRPGRGPERSIARARALTSGRTSDEHRSRALNGRTEDSSRTTSSSCDPSREVGAGPRRRNPRATASPLAQTPCARNGQPQSHDPGGTSESLSRRGPAPTDRRENPEVTKGCREESGALRRSRSTGL